MSPRVPLLALLMLLAGSCGQLPARAADEPQTGELVVSYNERRVQEPHLHAEESAEQPTTVLKPPQGPQEARPDLSFAAGVAHGFTTVSRDGSNRYAFGYDTGSGRRHQEDQPSAQSDQPEAGHPRLMRQESRLADGTVVGKYGYTDPFGAFRLVQYVAGDEGYFATEQVTGATSAAASAPAGPQLHKQLEEARARRARSQHLQLSDSNRLRRRHSQQPEAGEPLASSASDLVSYSTRIEHVVGANGLTYATAFRPANRARLAMAVGPTQAKPAAETYEPVRARASVPAPVYASPSYPLSSGAGQWSSPSTPVEPAGARLESSEAWWLLNNNYQPSSSQELLLIDHGPSLAGPQQVHPGAGQLLADSLTANFQHEARQLAAIARGRAPTAATPPIPAPIQHSPEVEAYSAPSLANYEQPSSSSHADYAGLALPHFESPLYRPEVHEAASVDQVRYATRLSGMANQATGESLFEAASELQQAVAALPAPTVNGSARARTPDRSRKLTSMLKSRAAAVAAAADEARIRRPMPSGAKRSGAPLRAAAVATVIEHSVELPTVSQQPAAEVSALATSTGKPARKFGGKLAPAAINETGPEAEAGPPIPVAGKRRPQLRPEPVAASAPPVSLMAESPLAATPTVIDANGAASAAVNRELFDKIRLIQQELTARSMSSTTAAPTVVQSGHSTTLPATETSPASAQESAGFVTGPIQTVATGPSEMLAKLTQDMDSFDSIRASSSDAVPMPVEPQQVDASSTQPPSTTTSEAPATTARPTTTSTIPTTPTTSTTTTTTTTTSTTITPPPPTSTSTVEPPTTVSSTTAASQTEQTSQPPTTGSPLEPSIAAASAAPQNPQLVETSPAPISEFSRHSAEPTVTSAATPATTTTPEITTTTINTTNQRPASTTTTTTTTATEAETVTPTSTTTSTTTGQPTVVDSAPGRPKRGPKLAKLVIKRGERVLARLNSTDEPDLGSARRKVRVMMTREPRSLQQAPVHSPEEPMVAEESLLAPVALLAPAETAGGVRRAPSLAHDGWSARLKAAPTPTLPKADIKPQSDARDLTKPADKTEVAASAIATTAPAPEVAMNATHAATEPAAAPATNATRVSADSSRPSEPEVAVTLTGAPEGNSTEVKSNTSSSLTFKLPLSAALEQPWLKLAQHSAGLKLDSRSHILVRRNQSLSVHVDIEPPPRAGHQLRLKRLAEPSRRPRLVCVDLAEQPAKQASPSASDLVEPTEA